MATGSRFGRFRRDQCPLCVHLRSTTSRTSASGTSFSSEVDVIADVGHWRAVTISRRCHLRAPSTQNRNACVAAVFTGMPGCPTDARATSSRLKNVACPCSVERSPDQRSEHGAVGDAAPRLDHNAWTVDAVSGTRRRGSFRLHRPDVAAVDAPVDEHQAALSQVEVAPFKAERFRDAQTRLAHQRYQQAVLLRHLRDQALQLRGFERLYDILVVIVWQGVDAKPECRVLAKVAHLNRVGEERANRRDREPHSVP